ncbi:hypothetical protein JR316_0004289 [Psilocybe cubensis]|uniref:Uncharacterized protein n=1 Tax=Psilocybe cubensis TaxID=181762 RepID=A0ACB8H4P0_PSICU|nr:hypothetical protein JR316_0004289 [Psilocybe cubensis]KAH9482194.1 hypothetical protein JR316_0004289 [Psilocybe cubensis]
MEKSTCSSIAKHTKTKKRDTVKKLKHINPRHFNHSFPRLKLVESITRRTARSVPLAPALASGVGPMDSYPSSLQRHSVNSSGALGRLDYPPLTLPDQFGTTVSRICPGTDLSRSSPYTINPLLSASDLYPTADPSREVNWLDSQTTSVLSHEAVTPSRYFSPTSGDTYTLGHATGSQQPDMEGFVTDYNQFTSLFGAPSSLEVWTNETHGYPTNQEALYPINFSTVEDPEVAPNLQETMYYFVFRSILAAD